MSTNTHVNDLKINKLKEAQFDAAVLSGVIDGTQLSIITDAGLSYNELNDLPQPVQVTSLPTASASELGNIYQFTGTTGTYTNGYFYKCVSDGASSPTYSWVQVEVQPSPDPLPSQAGNSGKFLTTDGTSTSWATVDALPSQSGQSGKFLTTDGTDASWGDALVNTATAQNALTILGTPNTTSNYSRSINIGYNSSVNKWDAIALGAGSIAKESGSLSIGSGSEAWNMPSIAIGDHAVAKGTFSIQLGGSPYGSMFSTNDEANTLKVCLGANTQNYKLLDGNGTIPEARLADTTNATAGQVLKLDSNLDAKWSGLSTSELTNDAGFISGISSSDVISALGYTPYNITNPNGYQANVIESISVNNTAQTITNKNVNIIVPTTAADVSALPSSTKYGANLSLSINSTTYVMTAQLKDQDGNNLGTAQTIDLPLESVVVNGEYDSVHKKIVLTLQSGSTVEFSVADLVSGLQTEITSTNKLDADLVDDSTSTNKFVTASDKTTWSGKQDALVSGTNIKTVNGNSLLGSGDVTIDSLPDQTGNSGKFLKTNGTTASWVKSVENTSTISDGLTVFGTPNTNGTGTINIGPGSVSNYGGVALGVNAKCTQNIGVAIASDAESNARAAVAIGYYAKSNADAAVQLGQGTNTSTSTLQFMNYQVINSSGRIPSARMGDTTSATSGQVLQLDSNLNAVWATPQAGSSTLSDLTDVTITSASSGQVLSYNGTNWENSDPTPAMVIVDYTA